MLVEENIYVCICESVSDTELKIQWSNSLTSFKYMYL